MERRQPFIAHLIRSFAKCETFTPNCDAVYLVFRIIIYWNNSESDFIDKYMGFSCGIGTFGIRASLFDVL